MKTDNSGILFSYNDYTTNVTEKIQKELGKEGFAELYDYIDNIPFIQHMISKDRPYAKDLERDKNGKIKVDITKLHILEDMDYFRPAALHFMQHGVYTKLYPNKNPNSAYKKFWDTEIDRCLNGYVRESDGEWIPGYYYFYLNYAPILQTVPTGDYNEDGSVRAERVYDFPKVWDGDYQYFHYLEQAEASGKFGAVLKTRGRGYSFKGGSMPIRNMTLIKKSKSFALADDTQYLYEDGLLTKSWDTLSWVNSHTAFKKILSKDTEEHKRAGYKDMNDGVDKGYMSEVIGVTLKNNPHRARGKRGKLIEWEEAGSFKNLLTAWKIAQKSLEDGNRVFGLMVAFGTGGEPGPGFHGLEQLFYATGAYRVYAVPNVWDKNASKSTCAFYVPEYMNRADCYDDNGNSDVIKALVEVIKRHNEIRAHATDANALTQEKAESSVTPQEAVMRVEGNVFPVADLKDHLATIAPNIVKFTSTHYIGTLAADGKWKLDPMVEIIREYPNISGKNIEGGIEIFKMPYKGNNGVQRGRYIIGVDPIDSDLGDAEGVSLASAFVFDLLRDEIVAEYTGRPQLANTFYENVLRLARLYNAQINYESNIKGLFAYFNNNHALHYLADVPQILKDMQLVKGNKFVGNRAKGTRATQYVNAWSRKLLSDWMLSKVEDVDDTEEQTIFLKLQTIRSVGLLKEAIMWNGNLNADRVSAMGMVMIMREEMHNRISTLESENEVEEEDEFFKINYTNNFEIAIGREFYDGSFSRM